MGKYYTDLSFDMCLVILPFLIISGLLLACMYLLIGIKNTNNIGLYFTIVYVVGIITGIVVSLVVYMNIRILRGCKTYRSSNVELHDNILNH